MPGYRDGEYGSEEGIDCRAEDCSSMVFKNEATEGSIISSLGPP